MCAVQHSHPLGYIPCKKLLLQRFRRHWSLQYFVLSSSHRRCGRGRRPLLVGAWQPVLPVGNATVGDCRGRSHSPVAAPGSHSAYFWGQTPAWGLLPFARPISTYYIYITQKSISYASGEGVALQPVVWSHLGFCSQCSLEQDPLKLGGSAAGRANQGHQPGAVTGWQSPVESLHDILSPIVPILLPYLLQGLPRPEWLGQVPKRGQHATRDNSLLQGTAEHSPTSRQHPQVHHHHPTSFPGLTSSQLVGCFLAAVRARLWPRVGQTGRGEEALRRLRSGTRTPRLPPGGRWLFSMRGSYSSLQIEVGGDWFLLPSHRAVPRRHCHQDVSDHAAEQQG